MLPVAVPVGIPGPEMPWPTCSGWAVETLVSSADPSVVSAVPLLTAASAPQPCGKVSISPAAAEVPMLASLTSPLLGSTAMPPGCCGTGLSAQLSSLPAELNRCTVPSGPMAVEMVPELET